jgi:hypothetical protein
MKDARVKIIKARTLEDLEGHINNFLGEGHHFVDLKIFSSKDIISLESSQMGIYVALIIWE